MKERAKWVLGIFLCAAVFMVIMLYNAKPVPSSGPSQAESTPVDTKAVCDQLVAAREVIASSKESVAEQFDEGYFETAEWKAFVDGYWDGFWKQHSFCKTCRSNGDVPSNYLK